MILTCMVDSVLPNLQCFTEPEMFICSIYAGFTTQSHGFHNFKTKFSNSSCKIKCHAGDLQLVPVYY